jgi:hypothetical protein
VDKIGLHLWGSNIDRKSSRFELDIAHRGGHTE